MSAMRDFAQATANLAAALQSGDVYGDNATVVEDYERQAHEALARLLNEAQH